MSLLSTLISRNRASPLDFMGSEVGPKMFGLIPRFDGTCFYLWRVNFEMYLQKEKLLPIVSGTQSRPEDPILQAAWDDKDLHARLILHAALGTAQKKHIISCKTSNEAYKTLMMLFGAAELVMITTWFEKFRTMKLKEGQSVAKHLAELNYVIGVFSLRGVAINEYESKMNLLRSMPESYKNVVQDLRSNPELKLHDVLRILLQEEMEKKSKANEDGHQAGAGISRRPWSKKKTPPETFRIPKKAHLAGRSPDLGPPRGTKNRPQTARAQRSARSYCSYSTDMTRDYCIYCKEEGHTIDTCIIVEMKQNTIDTIL